MTIDALRAEFRQAARPNERSAARRMLALAVAFGLAVGLAVSWPLFGDAGLVPDDARQFVFWMARWSDPGLFPNDPIADYFQAMSPRLFTALYRGAFALGVDPLTTNRLLPLALTVATTVFVFLATLRLCPRPLAGLLASAFVNLELWAKDDLTSGTPRAFVVPLTAMFIYALMRRNLPLATLAAVLMGGIYPAALLVALATLAAWAAIAIARRRMTRRHWVLAVCTGLAGAAMLVPFALSTSAWGPVIPADLARTWPEFQAWGRTRFFFDDPWLYWVCSPRSGLAPVEWCRYLYDGDSRAAFALISLLLLVTAAAVPFLVPCLVPRASDDSSDLTVLPALLIGSCACFLLAHALLFELHLPSRYIQHSLRLLAGIGFGIGAATLIHLMGGGERARRPWRRAAIAAPLALLLPGAVLAAPLLGRDDAFNVKYHAAEPAALYDYLALQPHDILVASLAREADDIPLAAGRRVLFSQEHSIPYHLGYYAPMRQAMADFIQAVYADDLAPMKRFIRAHGVSHLLLHGGTFDPAYIRVSWWAKQAPGEAAAAADRLRAGGTPALARIGGACLRGQYGDLFVIGAGCLLALPDAS